MASVDDIQAMLDDVYGVAGIAAAWTPAGATAVPFTGLVGGGDQSAQLHGLVAQVNVSAANLMARVSELASAAPGVMPRAGDVIHYLDANGAPIAAFAIVGDPRHPDNDHRQLQWAFDLAPA